MDNYRRWSRVGAPSPRAAARGASTTAQAQQTHSDPTGMGLRRGLHRLPGVWMERSQVAHPETLPNKLAHWLQCGWWASFQRVYVARSCDAGEMKAPCV